MGKVEQRTSEYLSELKNIMQTSLISTANGIISLLAAIIKRFRNCRISTLHARYLNRILK